MGISDPMTMKSRVQTRLELSRTVCLPWAWGQIDLSDIATWTLSSADPGPGREAQSSMAAKGFTAHCALLLCHTRPPLFSRRFCTRL